MSDATHAELLARIGQVLGAPLIEVEPARNGHSPHRSVTVPGGAWDDQGRVAWIEDRREPSEEGGPADQLVHCELTLHLARDGEVREQYPLPCYNPYFGCRVYHAGWHGGAFIVAFSEKHRALLGRLVPGQGPPVYVPLGSPEAVDGDVVIHVYEGLLAGWRVPTLEALPPVPIVGPYWWDAEVMEPGRVRLTGWAPREPGETGPPERERTTEVQLPPGGAVLSLRTMLSRTRALLTQAGVSRDRVGSLADKICRPWREPPPTAVTRYEDLPRKRYGLDLDAINRAERDVLTPLAPAAPRWGWSDDPDEMIRARIATLVNR